MIFSVYSYPRRTYEYYEAPGVGTSAHAGAPSRPAFASVIGATPEGAAWKLPWGARKIGQGVMPKGRIATSQVALGGLGDLTDDLPKLGIVAGLAYVAWRYLR